MPPADQCDRQKQATEHLIIAYQRPKARSPGSSRRRGRYLYRKLKSSRFSDLAPRT